MNPSQEKLMEGLPGAELILAGLRDLHENRLTVSSCLVRMARRRLARAGLVTPSARHDVDAELDLYHLLSHEGNQAHSRYNSLVRQLVSFEHALDHRLKAAS